MQIWNQFLAWLGPPVDDSTQSRPRWYRYGPTGFVLVVQILDMALIGSRPHFLWVIECVLLALLLLERRRWPLGVFTVAMAVEVLLVVVALSTAIGIQATWASGLALYWLLYSTVRWTEVSRYYLCAQLIFAGFGLAIPLYYFDPAWTGEAVETARSILVLWLMVAVVIGSALLRRRHCARADAQSRFDELQKRNALANEVHDVVGHHLSAIALRAEGARSLLATDPESADAALAAIRGAATEALNEIRCVVHNINENPEDQDALGPTLVDLDVLVESSVGGPVVRVTENNVAHRPSAATSRAAYRIVQEAITNARRHATGATRIEVRLSSDATHLTIEVSDDGSTRHTLSHGDGYGLRAMASRAALLDGTLRVGPTSIGGWLVHASLPLDVAVSGSGESQGG